MAKANKVEYMGSIISSRQHPYYMTWKSMRNRCNNPNAINYRDYGGRGIKVCNRWDSFVYFVEDMGVKPTPKHTLERIDNDKGYSPDNCKWATRSEQTYNQRHPSKSGIKGVYYATRIKRYIGYSDKRNGRKYLGTFMTAEEARNAVKLATIL